MDLKSFHTFLQSEVVVMQKRLCCLIIYQLRVHFSSGGFLIKSIIAFTITVCLIKACIHAVIIKIAFSSIFLKYSITVISEDCINHTEFQNIKYRQN